MKKQTRPNAPTDDEIDTLIRVITHEAQIAGDDTVAIIYVPKSYVKIMHRHRIAFSARQTAENVWTIDAPHEN
jgi:hypothetical protein